jgi:hypothetical protein
VRALSPLIAARCGLRLALLTAAALLIHPADAGPRQLVVTRSPADLYDAWRLAATEATLALCAWRDAPRHDKRAAHATYVAALEAEARAASLLSRSRPRRS